MSIKTTDPIEVRDIIMRDVLNVDTMRPFLADDAVVNATMWRFLQTGVSLLAASWLLTVPDPADATPAPLDPSKVKAGDTVTVERGTAVVTEKVSVVRRNVSGFLSFEGEELSLAMGGPNHWTLTAHQPAPEPEPEWKPGTVAVATVRGAKGIRVIRATNTGGSDPHEMDPTWISADLVDRGHKVNGYDGTYLHHDEDVTDVRPLVVIDPAEVDVDALADVFSARVSPSIVVRPMAERVIHDVLAALGIEES